MNETEFSAGGSTQPQPGIEELRDEVKHLRSAISIGLLLVFIFSMCVNVFLWWQEGAASSQAGQATALVNAWSKDGPDQKGILEFWGKLNEFARTHPDFVPVLNKYSAFFTSHPNTAAPAPAKKK